MSETDLDFDLHNAIQDLIGEGLLVKNALAHGVARTLIVTLVGYLVSN